MAYARLEIYWPDGRLESVILSDETVSVGRAEGNTIALDTEMISRYHFSLERDGQQVTITDLDSANGTFVDGVMLKGNQPYPLGDVEEIMIGSLRIIFRQVDDEPTLAMRFDDEETQRMQLGAGGFHVELEHSSLEVWPASNSSTELAITNLGKTTRAFAVQMSGMPSSWVRLTRPEVELDPDETAYILINVKPPRRPNTVPQPYQVTVEIAPVDEPLQVQQHMLEVQVRSYGGFGIAVGAQPDEDDPVPVFLHNQGSAPLSVTLSARDAQGALRFNLPNTPLELQAGQRLRVEVGVSAINPPLTGAPKLYPFVLQVKSQDAAGFVAAEEGAVTLKSRYPLWALLAAGGIALSIVIILMLALLGVLDSPEPVINSVSVEESRIAQGEMLAVTVDGDNVASYDLIVDMRVEQSDLPGDQQTFALDTSEMEGVITIEVIGRNGELSTRAQTSAEVYRPITIDEFAVTPDLLVRYTVNTLTISWDVADAEFVQIRGLSAFTNNLLQPSTQYAAMQTLEDIGGIPTEPLEIMLYAEDADGTAVEETILLSLVDPQCDVPQDIPLYEGPAEAYQQIGTITGGATVVVTAQDADAGWLRVRLDGDVRGWGAREAFTCPDFDLSTLRTEFDVPPLPDPLPEPTPEPLATDTPETDS